MSIAFRVNQAQVTAMKQRLSDARVSLKKEGVAMRQVATYLDQWVQRNFRDQGRTVGGWKPFKYGGRLSVKSKSTGKSSDGRRYVNSTAKLLMDTGHLRNSFLPFVRKGVAGIGSDLPYSKPHNEGTDKLPQRRMLPKDKEVKSNIREIIDRFVVTQLKKAGLT